MKTTTSNIVRAAGQSTGSQSISAAFFNSSLRFVALAALMLLCTVSLRAQDVWNGSSNIFWTNGANWNSGAPGGNNDIQFQGSSNLSNNNDYFLNSYHSITFNSGAGAFTLNGNALYMNGGGITNNSSNTQTLNFSDFGGPFGGIFINASQTWTAAAGNLQVNANINSFGNYTLTIDGAHDTTISGYINDMGNNMALVKNGTGTLYLANGANNYTGGTQLNSGITYATASGALGSGYVTVADGAAFGLNGDITLTNNISITGQGISGSGALFNYGGVNTIDGNITIVNSLASQGAVITSVLGSMIINGNISTTGPLATSSLVLNGSGTGTINGVINLGPNGGGIAKYDPGMWTLTGDNTYTGQTHVYGGILNIQNDNALGTVDGNTVIDNGATLQLQGGISVAEDLKISGTGAAGQSGVIVNVSGANQLSGQISLVANATISSDSNTGGDGLDITGEITGSGKTLTLSGSGGGNITGQINTGAGGIIKNGSGAWGLANLNTYTGQTTVNGGALVVSFDGALGSTTHGTTVNDGGTLMFDNVDYATKEAVTISGTGSADFIGAISNNGTSSFAGKITLANDAWIYSGGVGSQLTLTGGIVKDGVQLTFTGGFAGGGTIIVSGSGITGASPHSDLVVDNTTLVLSATSNYNGPTFIQNNGTLQTIGNNVMPTNTDVDVDATSTFDLNNYNQSIGALTGAAGASVTLGSGTLTTGNTTFNSTFSGVISGSGGVTKIGSHLWILNGINTYSGPTNINAGILQIGDGTSGNLNSASLVTVAGGAELDVNLANNDTLGNNIVNNGNIDAISSNINTLGGVISGTGNLLQNGSGLTILSGNSTYTGETVVFSGTLQVGNGVSGSINSLSQVLVDSGATLALDLAGNPAYFDNSILNDGWVQMIQSNTTYLRGTIYQSGSLSQDGTGLTILTGTNIYTGATNVNNGILRIGNGLTGSINGSSLVTVTSPGILQINMGQNGSIYNQIIDNGLIQWIQSDTNWQDAVSVISGTGSMLISGSGYTLLYGNNTFSGGTTIDNGSGSVGLANSNALGSGTVTINSGYTYSISPSVPLTINVGGYVQTGGEVQYLVTGNHSSTNFQVAGPVSITGGDVSLHNYVGSYTPSGAWTGNPTGDQQTLIHSTVSVTGAYADAFPYAYIKNNAFNTTFDYHHGITLLYPELAYDANNVYANWIQASFSSIPGLTPNQSAVASSLNYYQDHNGPSPDGLITYLDGQNVKKMPGLYDLIAPDELTAIFQIGFSGADVQNANIERHLEQVRAGATGYTSTGFSATSKDGKAVVVDGKNVVVDKNPVTPESKRWSFFLEGSGEFSSVGSTSNAGGYDFTTAGVTLGADYRVNENFAIGILGGYANSNGSLVNQGSLDLNSGKGGVYATVFGNGFYADALVGAGYNSYTTTRSSILGNANGSPDGWELDTLINGGYDFHHGDWSFGPIASVAYTQVNLNNFTESGSLAALKYPSQSQDSLRTNLGAKIVYTATIGGIKVTPQLRVSWQHGFLDNTQSIDSQFASGSSSMFTVSGPQMGRDSAMVSAGVNVQVTPTISVYTYYDGQLGRSNYSSNNVTGGVKVDF